MKGVLKVIGAIAAAYVVSVILLMLLAFVAYKAGMSENMVSYGIFAVYFLSTFVAGVIVGVKMKSRRAVWGVAVGMLYYAVIFVAALVMDRGIAASVSAVAAAVVTCVVGGFAGAVLCKHNGICTF